MSHQRTQPGSADAARETEAAIREMAQADSAPEVKAQNVASAIRSAGSYRWVGVYGVSPSEIWVIGWDGPSAPEHPRFPSDRGLCGAAVASASTIVVDDVASDPRYLTTFGTTRSEMVVPVRDAGVILGLIDVESDVPAAFGVSDQQNVERWGAASAPLWQGLAGRTPDPHHR
jgi:L-methionine (R)-S-oxide reductase